MPFHLVQQLSWEEHKNFQPGYTPPGSCTIHVWAIYVKRAWMWQFHTKLIQVLMALDMTAMPMRKPNHVSQHLVIKVNAFSFLQGYCNFFGLAIIFQFSKEWESDPFPLVPDFYSFNFSIHCSGILCHIILALGNCYDLVQALILYGKPDFHLSV